jgi:glycosyltransferase involved in cell wall biosynthesis
METITFLMTATYYPPFHVGGDAIHIKYLSEELAKIGHEVHVMYSLDAYNYKKSRFFGERKISKDDMNSQGVFIHTLRSPLGIADIYLTYLLGNSRHVNKEFNKLIETIKPEIVHHNNIFLLGYKILKKHRNYLSLYTAHDYSLICQRYDLLRNGKQVCNKKSCLSCVIRSKRPPQLWRLRNDFKNWINDIDVIIAPSNFMKDKLAEELDVRIEHIPNFVPPPPQKIKDSGYSNYFLYVGVLERHKGILDLLEVFKRYSDEINAKLIIVGKGGLEKQIKEFITKHNLQNKILFLGWVDTEMLWSLYKDALAIVMPSIWSENNPLVALEALSVGTPVIGSDQGGIPEIVEKVDKRLIFRAGDLEDIKRVLVEYDRRKYSVEKVKAVYEKWYSVDGYISGYFDILDRM